MLRVSRTLAERETVRGCICAFLIVWLHLLGPAVLAAQVIVPQVIMGDGPGIDDPEKRTRSERPASERLRPSVNALLLRGSVLHVNPPLLSPNANQVFPLPMMESSETPSFSIQEEDGGRSTTRTIVFVVLFLVVLGLLIQTLQEADALSN